MTLLNKALAHYCEICSRSETEKRNGWQCAQELAKKHPELLQGLGALITATMKARANDQTQQGGKSDV
jgi:hypothetical protein